ncbi:hypothetical protein IVB40_31665 [Bradyrhizobium sp. 40]|uniref:hypothetical protein n=1 Tax=Bradyrhizobium sp. 40 TaxID=2782674 RepID=UPI0020005B3F|nr:hypothetical protein [Bradyrhizobium sp. 40]UPJ41790.1 hypothetical protein IVB40_31665 [Bradyrhizobium sp. 40]
MFVTDKVFFASTLLYTTGCSPATFRAWRNRNRLFPETKDSGQWNKYSILDVLLAGVVFELTKAGIGAQLAVDAAMAAAPEITIIYGTPKGDEHSSLGAVVMRLLEMTSMRDFPVLQITKSDDRAPVSAQLIKPKEMPILQHFSGSEGRGMPVVATMVYLGLLFAETLLDLIYTESDFGRAALPPELLKPQPPPKPTAPEELFKNMSRKKKR